MTDTGIKPPERLPAPGWTRAPGGGWCEMWGCAEEGTWRRPPAADGHHLCDHHVPRREPRGWVRVAPSGDWLCQHTSPEGQKCVRAGVWSMRAVVVGDPPFELRCDIHVPGATSTTYWRRPSTQTSPRNAVDPNETEGLWQGVSTR